MGDGVSSEPGVGGGGAAGASDPPSRPWNLGGMGNITPQPSLRELCLLEKKASSRPVCQDKLGCARDFVRFFRWFWGFWFFWFFLQLQSCDLLNTFLKCFLWKVVSNEGCEP